MTMIASSSVAPGPREVRADRGIERRIREIRARAGHPHGYRLYDYRPDLLVLAGCVETVVRMHKPQRGVPAAAGGEGRCAVCLHAWPCPTMDAITGSLGLEGKPCASSGA